jgi:hypothetical protein
MRRILTLLTVALVMAAMMVAMAMPAFAAPPIQPPEGTCFVGGPTDKVTGCAGAVGGFIVAPNQECENINRGPFNTGEFSCP